MKKFLLPSVASLLFLFPFLVYASSNLSDRLSGRILLQVEEKGEAWYIEPMTKERAFLGRPDDAFRVMRELGLGISEKDFKAFGQYAPERLSGRIILRVEAKGEAYYVNPIDLKMHFLGRPADAFGVMRQMGLGVTNQDIERVPVFEKYAQQTKENTEAIKSLEEKVLEQNKKIEDLKSQLDGKSNTNIPTTTPITKPIITTPPTTTPPTTTTPTPTPTPLITPNNTICNSWRYSDWSECSIDGKQKRILLDALPSGCAGGGTDIERFCDYIEPKVVLEFSSSENAVYEGDRVVLTWSAQNATSCEASGGSFHGVKAISGTESIVMDNQSQIYKLICKNSSGSVKKEIFVSVKADLLVGSSGYSNYMATSGVIKMNKYRFVADSSTGGIVINNIGIYFWKSTENTDEFKLKLYNGETGEYFGAEQICNSDSCFVDFNNLGIIITAGSQKVIGLEYSGVISNPDKAPIYKLENINAQLSSGEEARVLMY